jgi:ATP-dependent Lhr-like helicase
MNAMDRFHPATRAWFEKSFEQPTTAQAKSWPLIAAQRHVLITAPTGSGKTLTAFLWSIDGFLSGRLAPGATRVLYVSPLKALNNDIQRNLTAPLAALAGQPDTPALRVATRSGDTSPSERQKLLRRPPEFLVTTPESLNLLLSTRRGQQALATVECVILDEIHAVIDNRRGTSLLTSLERLAHIAGEFQRIALSATVTPLATVAAQVAGCSAPGQPRAIEIVNAAADKKIELSVRFPEAARTAAENGVKIWEPLADAFRDHVSANTSTLFFTNSRRLTEKITLKINEGARDTLAYAHHGSLARELRQEVERRLKAGELKAIVATNSLEMGIDIGALDEVVMVQSPTSIASALQRLGRAGHQVNAVSRGSLYPTHAHDFLEAAVIARGIEERAIEPARALQNPLDVLAQIIISICAFEPWSLDALYDLLRCSGPYATLPRDTFESLVEMLAGRYEGARIRELRTRLSYDRIEGTVVANRGAVMAMYLGGGSIPERGYYQLRHTDSGALIGELDEEFVWEATTGQTFTLGSQAWQITQITHNDVLVRPATQGSDLPPFWRAESFNRSSHFSRAILAYLDESEALLAAGDRAAVTSDLTERRGFDSAAAQELTDYLAAQRDALDLPLPGAERLIIEQVSSGPGGYAGPGDPRQTVIHSYWGGGVNRPWALALAAVWPEYRKGTAEIHADNNAIVLQHRGPLDIEALLQAVTRDNLLPLLKQSLEGSGFFGARFRECAGRALLLGRARFKERLPLWLIRMQAKKLMQSVQAFEDFPILQETWRTCLHDEFDLPLLETLLDGLDDGTLTCQIAGRYTPSPFAANVTFEQISRYMYADDEPEGQAETGLRDDVLALAMADHFERPRVARSIIERFEAKRQRRAEGYGPTDADDWLEWIKERLLLPAAHAPQDPALLAELQARGAHIAILRDERTWWAHREQAHTLWQSGLLDDCTLRTADGQALAPADLPDIGVARDAVHLALECLSFVGPRQQADLDELLPSVPAALLTQPELLRGTLVEGSEDEHFCDSDNFEALLRFQRAARRAPITPRPLTAWPAFAWRQQGGAVVASDNAPLVQDEQRLDAIVKVIEHCRGYPAPLGLWLQDLFAARVPGYDDRDLDALFAEGELHWYGLGREVVTLDFYDEPALRPPRAAPGDEAANQAPSWFRDPHGRYSYPQLAGNAAGNLPFNDRFWSAVWAGTLSADSIAPLRQGERLKFRAPGTPRSGRRRLGRPGASWAGNWYLTRPDLSAVSADRSEPDIGDADRDALSQLDQAKASARVLLQRHGWACRELANRDHPQLRWRLLFKALRVLELAGEVQAGLFFEGFSGPQFARPQTVARLRADAAEAVDEVDFWLAATDPAAPSGLGLRWPDDLAIPPRRPGNYLAFAGGKLGMTVANRGKRLSIAVPPEDPLLPRLLPVLRHLARQQSAITVTTINDAPAIDSPYRAALASALDASSDHRDLFLAVSS